MRIGCFCPVWCEGRYLPLVIEQMELCPGPALLLWMDEPFHWYGKGPAPSGWASSVKSALPEHRTVVCLPAQAHSDLETNQLAYDWMREQGVEVVVRFDSDWLFTLADTATLYKHLQGLPDPGPIKRWNTKGVHYWKTWDRVYDSVVIGIASPIDEPNTWQAFTPGTIGQIPVTCYHPSYVLTDEECYRKVHSWEHAKSFHEAGFYKKQWLIDSMPTSAGLGPPPSIMERLAKHGALL